MTQPAPQALAGSVVDRAAEALRVLSLENPEGTFLGSEDEMISRLDVSRATLRQAASRVAQENFIAVRRGVGGGYFSARPSTMNVTRMAALYLRAHDADFTEITSGIGPLKAELAVLATRNRDPVLLARLEEFAVQDENAPLEMAHGYRAFLKSEREFLQLISALAGNSVINLLMAILYDFAALASRSEDVLIDRPERVQTYRRMRARLARAVIDADVELARLASRRCSELVDEWFEQDFKGRTFDGETMD
jgi:GntR family transcriptional repressor for pyruvate dehydrogenase complex